MHLMVACIRAQAEHSPSHPLSHRRTIPTQSTSQQRQHTSPPTSDTPALSTQFPSSFSHYSLATGPCMKVAASPAAASLSLSAASSPSLTSPLYTTVSLWSWHSTARW